MAMQRLRPTTARCVMVLACFLGLFSSGYLLYTYLTGAPITCAVVSGCEQVRASKWAYTFGIPRPFLGLVFYAGVFALLVMRAATTWQGKRLYQLTIVAAVVAFVESGFLFAIQWLDVKAFCFWCLLSALSSVALLVVAPFDIPQTHEEIMSRQELARYFIALLIFFPVAIVGFILLIR